MPIHDAIRQRLQPLAASVTSNRIMLYAFMSTCAMMAAIANACVNQSNFYAVMIHLSRSGRSVLVLANFGFVATLFIGRVMQRIFFGPLQPREVERLYDQTWMFVTESLLAFTIFRDEFDIPFVIMFGFLLFIKCFHWLMADRVESMDQVTFPGPPVLFHVRMNALFLGLSILDFLMFTIAVDSTLNNGVGGMVLFATEYAILMASAINAMARYSLNNLDYRRASSRGGENAPPWEHKSMYVFYIELVTDFLKLATYLTFFTIILTFYGIPLNIIRDVYLTARSFITRLRALIRYHNATRDMDRRYPNATEEELAAMSDRTCIICREELTIIPDAGTQAAQPNEAVPTPPVPPQQQDGPNMTPKKLPCGHVFHFQCLRSWLERQQSCPTCRRTVLETDAGTRNDQQQRQQQRQQPAANGAVRPPAPQPGAAPQPFLPVQPGQQLPQNQNQSLFFNILRRALGLAVQPPLVPGQFPNQFGPQAQAPPFGYGPQLPPPPPGYYYNPYYPYPPPPPPPQQLHAAPVVRGFYGPGGVWHPWPLDQGQAQDPRAQNPPPAPTPSATPPQPHSQSPPPPGAVPTPVYVPLAPGVLPPAVPLPAAASSAPLSESSSSISSESSAGVESQSDSSNEDDDAKTASTSEAATPREAAALAALKRLGASSKSTTTTTSRSKAVSESGVSSGVELRPAASSGGSSTSSATAKPTPTTRSAPSANRDSEASQSQPAPTLVAADSVPLPSPTPTTNSRAPALLPLYDPTRPMGSQGVNYHHPSPYQHLSNGYQTTAPPYGPSGWRPAGPARMPNPNNMGLYQPTRPTPYPSGTSSRSTPSSSSRALRPNLNTLPTTLTDEQLSRLDRVTREAIDERLRVLEGVSAAVHRCIEELTRVRSVLPPGTVASALTGATMRSEVPVPVVSVPPTATATVPAPSTSTLASTVSETTVPAVAAKSSVENTPVASDLPSGTTTDQPSVASSSVSTPPAVSPTSAQSESGSTSGDASSSSDYSHIPPDHPIRQWAEVKWRTDGKEENLFPEPPKPKDAGSAAAESKREGKKKETMDRID